MTSLYGRAKFLQSALQPAAMPLDQGAEVAFVGRSNAGKSSAINAVTGTRALARISKAPGRTRLINFFLLARNLRLVDLPGYGYAKVAAHTRRAWGVGVEEYLRNRRSLHGVILLMDARHPLTALDQALLESCRAYRRPVHVVLTKSDKLKRGAARAVLREVRASVGECDPVVALQLFSATRRTGVDELRARLDDWLKE
jgi:GTP-binding protein